MEAVYRDRRRLVAEYLGENPRCHRCFVAPSVDVHEIKTRARGGSILDPENFAALCRPCHNWVTTHPAEATVEGWLRNSWED